MRRLIREGNPPSGQLASPVPQYWNPSTEAFEDVLGAHGAPRSILYGPNGEPISQINPLPIEGKVQLTGQFVRESTDPMPDGKEGDSLFLWDTRQVYLHDGTDWREV